MANPLKSFGFTTPLYRDVTKNAFLSALDKFRIESEGAEFAVIYYSGSGFAVAEISYLSPIDHPPLQSGEIILSDVVPASAFIKALDGVPGPKLVILDNCRDDPFAPKEATGTVHRSRIQSGLAPEGADRNLLIAYSTRYGGVAMDGPPGTNSPYTGNLVKILNEPGLEARMVLDRVRDVVYRETNGHQDPSTEGSLGSKLVFINPQLAETPTKSLSTSANTIEEASKAFGLIKDSGSPPCSRLLRNCFPIQFTLNLRA